MILRVVVAFAALAALTPGALAESRAEEVQFPGFGELELLGTLQLPGVEAEEGKKHAAVLLLPGSGPTDRDGNQGALKTELLKQIAEHLAENGVASLRFDKRATQKYRTKWPAGTEDLNVFFSYESFIGDAAAAFRYVRDRPEVDATKVMILGHSEGGLLALQLASDMAESDARPAGLILAGTAGRALDAVLHEQIDAMLTKQGMAEDMKASWLKSLDEAMANVKQGLPVPQDLPPGLRQLFNPTSLKLLRAYILVDPTELARRVKGPVLILQGEKDAQISVERDMPRLREALKSRGHGETVDTAVIAGASHNFKAVVSATDLGFIGPVVPDTLATLTTWLEQHLK